MALELPGANTTLDLVDEIDDGPIPTTSEDGVVFLTRDQTLDRASGLAEVVRQEEVTPRDVTKRCLVDAAGPPLGARVEHDGVTIRGTRDMVARRGSIHVQIS